MTDTSPETAGIVCARLMAQTGAGHAIQFRCRHSEALRMRVDVMAKMGAVDKFPNLWKRRTTIELPDGIRCDLLSVPDLVHTKKIQRDKD